MHSLSKLVQLVFFLIQQTSKVLYDFLMLQNKIPRPRSLLLRGQQHLAEEGPRAVLVLAAGGHGDAAVEGEAAAAAAVLSGIAHEAVLAVVQDRKSVV